MGDDARDHPRSRGEYFVDSPDSVLDDGSSPLSRGILTHVEHQRRIRGSSPLSRGIPGQRCGTSAARGIIPALAGNTPPLMWTPLQPWDHPRSRGEYGADLWFTSADHGSSPLSRGIRESWWTGLRITGIIPALAGNTIPTSCRKRQSWDHPRSRGEYFRHKCPTYCPAGSSPLSRGIRCGVRGDYAPRRIIPALAGNTAWSGCGAGPCTDHPRSRGEYNATATRTGGSEGSSPLSRGIPGLTLDVRVRIRIIPALAGNTSRCSTSRA